MGDTYREILIKRETPMQLKIVKALMIAVCALVCIGGVVLIPLLLPAGLVLAVAAWFAASRFDVEYEYLYVNGELDIDAIYSRQKRKKMASYDMHELEILAPSNSHALDSYKNNKAVKCRDFTSGNPQVPSYTLILNCDNTRQCVKVELDEEIINDIRRIAPRKVNLY